MVSGSSTGICALCLIAAAAAEPDASFGSYDGSYGSGSFADAWAGLFNEDGSYSYSSFGSFGSLGANDLFNQDGSGADEYDATANYLDPSKKFEAYVESTEDFLDLQYKGVSPLG